VFVALISTPYLVNRLTPEGYGVYALLTSLMNYYGLLDLGLGEGVTKFVSEYNADGDLSGISQSINAAIIIQVLVGLPVSVLLVVFADPILDLLKVSDPFRLEARVGLYASAPGLFVTMMSATISSVLRGLQRYDITGKVSAATNLLLTTAVVIAVYLEAGIGIVMLFTLASSVAVLAVYIVAVVRELPYWRLSLKVEGSLLKSLFSFSGFAFVTRVSSVVSTYVVRFVVGFFLGPEAVTFYVVPWRLVVAVGGLLSNAFGVLFPYASELGARSDRKRVQDTFVEGSRIFAALAIPLFLTLIIFSKQILTVWIGEDLAGPGAPVLSLLALASLVGALTTVPNLVTMGLGHAKVIGIFSIATVVFYIVLLPSFTKIWGITGTAWAMVGASAPGIALVGYQAAKLIGVDIWRYLRKVIGFHAAAILAMPLLSATMRKAPVDSLAWTLVPPALFSGVYFLVMLGTGHTSVAKLARQLGQDG
jgi:O-antigen/teichoic acid export membrane protein